MTTTDAPNYVALDVPEILIRLFHPRPEVTALSPPTVAQEVLMPVAPGVDIGGRFYAAGALEPTLLYFHGNGEIVADYEELGPVYTQQGLNFFPVDYRGYGRSTGSPTVSAMMRDCHTILDFALEWLGQRGFSGPLVVMGRSLGSASVLELADHHQEKLQGLGSGCSIGTGEIGTKRSTRQGELILNGAGTNSSSPSSTNNNARKPAQVHFQFAFEQATQLIAVVRLDQPMQVALDPPRLVGKSQQMPAKSTACKAWLAITPSCS